MARRSRGGRQAVGQVALVEDDQRRNVLAFGGEQSAGDQFVGKGRFGGDDDDDLVDVGGDQFLADLIGAVEQAAARLDGLDDTLIVRCALNVDAVAAGDLAFLAAREAGQSGAVGQFDHILPAVGGDDPAFHQLLPGCSCRCAMRCAAGGCES